MSIIPIYIINLRRTPERRLQIQRQLDAFGLEYRFIEAVDAYDLNADELSGLKLDCGGDKALACTLSHIKCYDEIIKNKHPIACILEDDAELLPSFPDILSSKKLQNKKWEVLLLGHCSHTSRFLELYYEYLVPSTKSRSYIYDGSTIGVVPGNFSRKIHGKHYIASFKIDFPKDRPLLTVGYLVRLLAAKNLREIAYANRKSFYIDDLTGCADLFGMSLKLITPPCVKLSPAYTYYSNINPLPRNIEQDTSLLPEQELLHRLMRNKWSCLVILIIQSLLNRYRKKFVLRLLRSLIGIELRNGINYFRPSEKYPSRVLLAKRRYMEHKQSKR